MPIVNPKIKILLAGLAIFILLSEVSFAMSGRVYSFGQANITGRVVDRVSNKPIPGAAIKLVTSETTTNPLAAAVTDALGKYTLKGRFSGSYYLKCSSVGFTAQNKKVYLTSNNQGSYNFDFSLERVNYPPLCQSVKLTAALITQSAPVIFEAAYSDMNGSQDIKEAYLAIGLSAANKDKLYCYYDQNNNKLYLRNDNDAGWLGGYAPGTKNNIENKYGILDCSGTSVVGTGQSLKIKWKISFKEDFAGVNNIFAKAHDNKQAVGNWSKLSEVCVLRKAPSPQ